MYYIYDNYNEEFYSETFAELKNAKIEMEYLTKKRDAKGLPADFGIYKKIYEEQRDMSKAKLLPCPFCGGEAEINEKSECYGHGDFGTEYFVRCKSCGASGKRVSNRMETKADAVILAAGAWNNRKPTESVQKETNKND